MKDYDNERLSSLAILHIHKHNDITDIIDGIITEFARRKGTHLALLAMSLMVSPFTLFCHKQPVLYR